jgi:hypothetical protein
MSIHRTFATFFATLAFAAPLAAGAQTAPNALAAQTNTYFAALAAADGRALGSATSRTFHVILPDGTRPTNEAFFRQLADHYLIASGPVGTVKIGQSTISDTTATESVETSTWDYALDGARHGPALERDYAKHQLTWIKSANGTWLLDEDHITSAVHT